MSEVREPTMGRGEKTIFDEHGIEKRNSGYYYTPEFVSEFIVKRMLEINPQGKLVLDPCVGKEEMLQAFYHAGKVIDSFDIIEFKKTYSSNFKKIDFLDFFSECKKDAQPGRAINLKYDYYIANPPYNCHEVAYIRKNKDSLSALFSDIGVLNMYSMFIAAMIDCAKPGATIGLITLDSFLTAAMHIRLRRKILEQCAIHTIILCPKDLFRNQHADVRTCLMILSKGREDQKEIQVANRPINTLDFENILRNKGFKHYSINDLVLENKPDSFSFVIDCPPKIKSFFNYPRLGDQFNCITGISTGNDSKYLSENKTEYFTIPFYKNPGLRRFYTQPDGYLPLDFLNISRNVKNFMVRNKPLLFKPGITCSSMGVPFTACYLPKDSTYGVNPNIICDESDIWWLLSYLNSSLATYLVRGILLRSNMITSGYVSRIPIIPLDLKTKELLSKIALEAYHAKSLSPEDIHRYLKEIDQLIFTELELSATEINHISDFCRHLTART